MKYTNGIYTSNLFSSIPHLSHGFTTKKNGDMREGKKRTTFLKNQGLDPKHIIWAEQIHNTHIHVVEQKDFGTMIKNADGLVYSSKSSSDAPVLFVHTADCTPVLALDPKQHRIGLAHAGWKGTVGHIAKKLIEKMESLGAVKTQILVAIGPHIGPCCYNVTKKRAQLFEKEYPKINIRKKERLYFVDIGMCNYTDLLTYGIPNEHIDYDNSLCTSCKSDMFYSYRKEQEKLSGQMIGFIGYKKKKQGIIKL